MSNNQLLLNCIRQHYETDDFIPLHAPKFDEHEKRLLNECIDSTFVSSVGKLVEEFEQLVADYTGAKYAISVTNGTMGLFLALKTLGVAHNDLVLTQSLSFVATANAISMLGAKPVFLDINRDSLGLCPLALKSFLENECYQKVGKTFYNETNQVISACMPMHTLGFSVEIDKIVAICKQYNIKVVEDAAESLGSRYKDKHTGTFGDFGVFSFNGNKIITTGGGGMLITNNEALAKKAKHLSTTAKVPHQWLFEHDEIGYNLRMPNLNAALGVAQIAKLDKFLIEKKQLNHKYKSFIKTTFTPSRSPPLALFSPTIKQQTNHWLNALVFNSIKERDIFLVDAKQADIQARPLWTPMHQLDIYKDEIKTNMKNTEWFAERLVNIPSGVV